MPLLGRQLSGVSRRCWIIPLILRMAVVYLFHLITCGFSSLLLAVYYAIYCAVLAPELRESWWVLGLRASAPSCRDKLLGFGCS